MRRALGPARALLAAPDGRAVALAFAACGVAFASWASRIPDVQARLDLGEGALGVALLGLAVGSVAGMVAVGGALGRRDPGPATWWSALALAAAISGPPLGTGTASLFGWLALAGAANGALDIAMNAEGARIETALGRPVLSACHGFFSLGALVGAAAGAAVAGAGVPVGAHLAGAGLALAVALATVGQPLRRARPARAETGGSGDPAFAVPRGPLAGLAAVAACVMVGEGAVADWSAVFLRSAVGSGAAVAGLGFAAFSLAMTAARFFGDALAERAGDRAVVVWGAAAAAAGLGAVVASPALPLSAGVAVAGFGLVGLGYAGAVPVLFRAAARVPGVAPGVGIAAVGGAGYGGFLVGPPLVGGVAEAAGLPAGLGVVAALAVLAALGAAPALRAATGAPSSRG